MVGEGPKREKSPLDLAADVFVYAPVGVALEIAKHLPSLASEGRKVLEGPLTAAVGFGKLAAEQGRRQFDSQFGGANPADETAARPATQGPAASELGIDSYDTMPVADVLAHLDSLGLEEVGKIRAYEAANRGRTVILDRCDELIAKTQGD